MKVKYLIPKWKVGTSASDKFVDSFIPYPQFEHILFAWLHKLADSAGKRVDIPTAKV